MTGAPSAFESKVFAASDGGMYSGESDDYDGSKLARRGGVERPAGRQAEAQLSDSAGPSAGHGDARNLQARIQPGDPVQKAADRSERSSDVEGARFFAPPSRVRMSRVRFI